MTRIATYSTKIPAWTYVLGDPCYTLIESAGDQFWEEGKVNWNFYNTTIDGYRIVAFSTAHGDGCYRDNLGREIGVDAGVIGLVPIELADPAKLARCSGNGYVHVVTFKRAVTCSRSATAVLKFGPYKIKTQ